MITVADVLDFLVSRSAAPSNFGAQLDRMRSGITSQPDPFRSRDDVEAKLMAAAALIRCIDEFTSRKEFQSEPRRNLTACAGYKALDKLQIASSWAQGVIAIGILRAYHERSTQSQERGLLEVYRFIASFGGDAVPPPPKATKDLLMSFRDGTAKRARNMACESYADSLLALSNFVRIYNKKNK